MATRRAILSKLSGSLAGIWAGVLLGVGAIGTPAGFATVEAPLAGRIAARMLKQEAHLSLLLALAMVLLLRPLAREAAEAGRGSLLNAELLLVFGTVFCTVLGYFAVQPMMEAAKAGEGPWSFGALHGISMACFGLKIVLTVALAWRLARSS